MHSHHYKDHVCSDWCLPCSQDTTANSGGGDLEYGIITNVAELLHQLRYETRRELKRHDCEVDPVQPNTNNSIFAGLVQSLVTSGHAYNREGGVFTCAPNKQSSRLATSLRIWLVEDTLATVDLANHHYLSQNYPIVTRRRRPRDGDLSEEPMARRARAKVDDAETENPEVIVSLGNAMLEPAVGEDFDDDLANVVAEDTDKL